MGFEHMRGKTYCQLSSRVSGLVFLEMKEKTSNQNCTNKGRYRRLEKSCKQVSAKFLAAYNGRYVFPLMCPCTHVPDRFWLFLCFYYLEQKRFGIFNPF